MAGPSPPPPPPVVAITDVAVARAAAASARDQMETTIARAAASFTEDELQARVDGEWSTVESLRHLVLVIDLWLSRTILGEVDPFDPMALPPSFMPPTLFPGTSIDPSARPSFASASSVLRRRVASLCAFVEGMTGEELARSIPGHAGTVGGALRVIFDELSAHCSFVHRDLDRLRAGAT